MESRFKNILGLLSGAGSQLEMQTRFSPYIIEGFVEVSRNEYAYRFELKTDLSMMMKLVDSDLKHRNERTFLQLYLPA